MGRDTFVPIYNFQSDLKKIFFLLEISITSLRKLGHGI